jgi:hypothetical protein
LDGGKLANVIQVASMGGDAAAHIHPASTGETVAP